MGSEMCIRDSSMGEPEGFCKLVVAAPSGDEAREAAGQSFRPGQILGCHLFGAHSSDIVQEIAAVMNGKVTVDELRNIVHAHPTLTEVLISAASEGR